MLTSLNTPEIYRLTLLIGAFVALHYKDKYGVIPGGIIVPGFAIILFLVSPIWCLTTLVLSFLVYFIYQRFLARNTYKLQTPMYILASLSLAIANLVILIYLQIGWMSPSLDNLYGTLMPGIIAFHFTKQNMVKVIKGLTITTVITALILGIIYLTTSSVLQVNFNTLKPLYSGLETLELKYHLVQFYIALAAGYLIYRFRDVRSGGYLVAPVAATMLLQPVSAVMFLLGCFVVYFATQLICNLTLIVGLKRYALVLFLTTIFNWGADLLVAHLDPTILPFQGSYFFVIIAMASYVNDSIVYGTKNIFQSIIFVLIISAITIIAINILSVFFG